jgi:hypothetical protein
VAGSRHLEVVELLGRPTERQALLLSGDDLTDSDHAGLRAALDRLEQVDVWALAASRSLRDLAAGPIGELISTAFRVMPRQPRSMETVERLLAAGEAIVKRKRRLDRLTMETVADEAGVTPPSGISLFWRRPCSYPARHAPGAGRRA